MNFKFLISFLFSVFLFTPFILKAETISNIDIVPDLDISLFSPYVIKADVSGSPTSVFVDIKGINGEGGNYWNYYIDGIPESETITKIMTFDAGENKYISQNIYPDSIYPEIFFAPSSITWNNTPSNIDVRRNYYHLFHFNNPYTMTDTASFFIELNAVPRTTVNSANLDVYLVEKGKGISFFNSDWRNSPDVELMGSFDKNAVFHHTHVVGKAAHHLITLSTNLDGTIGTKNLDISNDFWIILYSNSPNTNRGWDLKYQDSSLCDNTNRWYIGNQSNWGTTTQSGCPDSHIHIARRDALISDGVFATVTANYSSGDPVIETQQFSFGILPNLPPNPTSFISPVGNGVYDGGIEEIKTLNISWNPANDSNGDNLTYNLYLLDENGNQIGDAIVSNTTETSFNFNITAVANGTYGLRGEVCDTAPLCTTFTLSRNFVIEKVAPIYSLTNISITSNNANDSNLAKAGDIISLSFTVSDSGNISSTLNVNFYSGGTIVSDTVEKSINESIWTAVYTVSENDLNGVIDFTVTAENLDLEYSNTNDSSYVIVDSVAPDSVIASPIAGSYRSDQNITLSSTDSSQIRYTLDGSNPNCFLGTVYVSPIEILESKTIKAISCDLSGNNSSIFSFVYYINKTSYGSYLPGYKSKIVNKIVNSTISVTPIETKFIFTKTLRQGMTNNEIKELQKFLNKKGYNLALIGPGSKGNETNYFGKLTRKAVIKFQKANNLVPDGIVGPLTRKALNN